MYTKSTVVKNIRTVLKLLFTDPTLLKARLLSLKKPPLFLFQMGKVASKTHDRTLNHLYFVQHFHDQVEFDAAYARGCKNFKGSQYYPHDIITGTRDPLTRKISTFFQNITAAHYDFSYKSKNEVRNASVSELISRFRSWSSGINEATGWFDRHFLPKTGIDVYASSFDPEQGWQLIETDQFRVVIVKLEDIRKNHVLALNALLAKRFGNGETVEALISSNLSEDKWYSEKMRKFKETISFSEEELDEAYGSKYMLHFYSAEQIHNLRSKWVKV